MTDELIRPDQLEDTVRVLFMLPKTSVFMWVLVKVLLSTRLYGCLCVCVRMPIGNACSAFFLPGLGGAEPQQAPIYQHRMRGDRWVLETTKFSSSRLGRSVGPNFPGFGSLKQSQVSLPAVSVAAKNPQAVQKLCGGFRVTLNQLTASWIFYSASEFSFIL